MLAKIEILNSAAAAAEFRIWNLGIKEVMVVRNLDFVDWSFPESAAAKLKNIKV